VFSSLRLSGSNDYSIEILGVGIGSRHVVTLRASKGPLSAEYEVPTTESHGIHGELPSLGAVSLHFKRAHRPVRSFGPHCQVVTEKGVFHGSVRFAGEFGYTDVKANGGPGKVERFPDGLCDPIGDRPKPPSETVFPFIRSTDLTARSQSEGAVVTFSASRTEPSSRTVFRASLGERREKMRIDRRASAIGSKDNFETSVAGKWPKSAVVTPPEPFLGSATFERPDSGVGSAWAGSLSVELPGATPTGLAGPGFTAALCVSCALHLPL
jgi:hypothetical protein